MNAASLALILAAVLAAPTTAFAQGLPPTGPREATLVVSGDSTVKRDPDIARLSAEIVTNDDGATRSAGKNSAIYETLVKRLGTLGISGAAIRTTSFDSTFVARPKRPLDAGEIPQRYGFVTSRSLEIDVVPIDGAGKVVDAALAAGATRVGDVVFDLADRKAAYREALGRAFADARANALALVAGSEVRLVRVRNIGATDYVVSPPRPIVGMEMRAMAAPLPQTQIDRNGPIDVTAHVTVTYEIREN